VDIDELLGAWFCPFFSSSAGCVLIWAGFIGSDDSCCASSLRDLMTAFSGSFLRLFRFDQVVDDDDLSVLATSAVTTVEAACCFRKASSSWAVSFLTASSLARSEAVTESRKSISSSSRERNWFFSLACSSNSACLEASDLQRQRDVTPTNETANCLTNLYWLAEPRTGSCHLPVCLAAALASHA
jgi:hypothetical protein